LETSALPGAAVAVLPAEVHVLAVNTPSTSQTHAVAASVSAAGDDFLALQVAVNRVRLTAAGTTAGSSGHQAVAIGQQAAVGQVHVQQGRRSPTALRSVPAPQLAHVSAQAIASPHMQVINNPRLTTYQFIGQ